MSEARWRTLIEEAQTATAVTAPYGLQVRTAINALAAEFERLESLAHERAHQVERLEKERDEAQGHVRNHHKEACEPCAVTAIRSLSAQADAARLREALESIAANTCCSPCQEAALVARAALRGDR